MAILCQATITNFNKIAIMAILVWVDKAINMVNMGVSANGKNLYSIIRIRIRYIPVTYFYKDWSRKHCGTFPVKTNKTITN